MLHVNGISKHFGDKKILSNIHISLRRGEVVGLVGKNGTGKSTLMKIITGELSPDDGVVHAEHEIIGYVPQYPTFTEKTVGTFLSTDNSVQDYEVTIALTTVALSHIEKDQLIQTLSGGEKTKLYLAKLLLQDPLPTILLLDEPTNNLDLEGMIWLEEFITSYDGAVLMTSHDRYFLDDTADSIIELEEGNIKTYGGNYSFYREQKEIEKNAYERMYEAQQKKIQKVKEDIMNMEVKARSGEEKFGSSMPYQRRKIRKSAQQMASRKQRLEKFIASEKYLDEPIKKIVLSVRVSGKNHSGKSVIYVKNVTKSFENHIVLDKVTFTITGNEHIWLFGANGSGKSTLFKIIQKEMDPDEGMIEVGAHIHIGYFSQERQGLSGENTILDELQKAGLTKTESYKLALRFNFIPDDLSKKINELSTGQQAKVAFALLTSGDYQLLILDEPTNHLEIETREVIEDALKQYKGALLIASHDRYFLEQVTIDKTYMLYNGTLKVTNIP